MQHAHRYTRLTALALGITGALALGQVHASGFQLKENSVKAQGRAFAGTGVAAGDTSVVANNPAAMTQFEGTTVQTDVTVIDLNARFEGGGYDLIGRPLTGGDGGEAGDVTPVPAMSLIHKFNNGLTVGAMVSAPFGLKTEYEPGWVGRYYAAKSELKTVDLTLSAAFELVPDHLSVGGGIIWEKAEAELSKTVDFGAILFGQLPPAARPTAPAFARPQGSDGFAKVEGDDTGMGWVIGVNFRPNDKLAIGLSHRSEIDHDLSGTVDWTVPAAVAGGPLGATPLFKDGRALAKLTTPSVTTVSVEYKFNDQFSLLADYAETDWSSLQEIRIDFANPDADSVEHFGWDTTRFMSLGAEYKLNDAWTLRAGYAYDETPTTYATRTPRLPDEDRKWYSIGATWNFSEQLEFSFAYTRIEPDRPQIGIVTPAAQGGQRLFGSYDSNVNLFGASAQYHF
ncbi:OmpP1/FadL family transporter [Lysobacter silvisoli]|uniref:Transporter n=1 Tax=Lysobacter silvisoli TaxID=2293254 RepID=A0A371JWS7_9GAMM|nr:porin [Lysobacter silvisoli]RDZ26098.1 transporter [Lysobacter silvisoli]